MLKRIQSLDYDAENVAIFIHSTNKLADSRISKWLEQKPYTTIHSVPSTDGISEPFARKMAMQFGLQNDCQFIFFVDGYVQLTNGATLKRLVEANRDLVAPALSRYAKLWSNYWGAIGSDGQSSKIAYSSKLTNINFLENLKIENKNQNLPKYRVRISSTFSVLRPFLYLRPFM